MILLTNIQNIYVIFASIGIAIILVLLIILYHKNVYLRKHLDRSVYFKLSHLAKYNDYLLLNKYFFRFNDKDIGKVDHILISNKFIYLINDFSESGVIYGDYLDEQLHVTDKNGERMMLNHLTYNRNIARYISLANRLDISFIKGIVVINDDSHVDISNIPEQYHICRRCELLKTIKEIDSIDIKPFKENDIVRFINTLDSINLKGINENDL